MLGLVALAIGGVALLAVLIDAPTAAWTLAGVCLALAVYRGTAGREPVAFQARSRTFDVTALVIGAAALAVLAPAGYLT